MSFIESGWVSLFGLFVILCPERFVVNKITTINVINNIFVLISQPPDLTTVI